MTKKSFTEDEKIKCMNNSYLDVVKAYFRGLENKCYEDIVELFSRMRL